MEISIAPIFQHVTWTVIDFLEMPQESDFYLDSPEFLFSGDSYCLRLYPKVNRKYGDYTEFHVRRLSVNFPRRKISCRAGMKMRARGGYELCTYYEPMSSEGNYFYGRSFIERKRDVCVPDGNFTLVCSMRLREESRVGSSESETPQREEEQQDISGHCASFSSRLSATKMELSTHFPCTHVELTINNFFELPRETVDSLTSSEFLFAGDAYYLRFHPNRDLVDTDLQIVRLTSTFPERTVCYRAGYGGRVESAFLNNSRLLVGSIGLCLSWSKLVEEKNKYERRGTLRLVLFMHLEEQNSAGEGTSDAAQKQSGLPDKFLEVSTE